MLHKAKGIVLHIINYNDKYLLAHIFTDIFGSTTYMVSKSRSKNNKVSKALFSPLAILDLEIDHQASRDIQRIGEAQTHVHLHGISANMSKTSMAFFLSEFLSRVLKDSNDTEILFNYLNHSIQILDKTENSIANFHLVMMLKLSHFMGFYPNLEEYKENAIFDMINAEFVLSQPLHKHFVNRSESMTLARLARINYENMHKFKFSRRDRVSIIGKMLDYYRLHLYDFPQLKSLDVLHELF